MKHAAGCLSRRGLLISAIVLVLAVSACQGERAPSESESPLVQEVAPRTVSNDREVLIVLRGSGFRPGVRVAVGPKLVGRDVPGRVTWVNANVVAATFGPGLPAGDYDVGVTNLDGKWSKLDAALRIRAGGAAAPPAPIPPRTLTPTPLPTPPPTLQPAATPGSAPVETAAPTPSPRQAPTPSPAPGSPAQPSPVASPQPTPTATPTQGVQIERNPPEGPRVPSR